MRTVTNRMINVSLKQGRWVLLCSTLPGLGLGALAFNMQYAVEQGQILWGLVWYPLDNPTYIYSAKLWNVWAQLSSLGLHVGFSERSVSLALSALAGLLIAWSFALWALALTKDTFFALLAPYASIAMIYALQIIYVAGYTYPIMLVGAPHTYGMLGLSFMFFITGLMAIGWSRVGFFLLGLALCVHPSLGVWTNLMIFASLALDFKNLRTWIRPASYVFAGYAISAVSYLV